MNLQKINKTLDDKITSLKEKKEHKSFIVGLVDKSLSILSSQSKDVIKAINKTSNVKVENFNDAPKEVEVLNFPKPQKPVKEIKVTNFPKPVKQKEYPKQIDVTVKNPVKEIKVSNFPDYPKFPSLKGIVKGLSDLPNVLTEKLARITQPVSVQNQVEVFVLDPKTEKRIRPGGGTLVPAASSGGYIGLRNGIASGQVVIAETGVAVQLPNVEPKNGVLIRNGGTTDVFIGGASVNNTTDGTGNGMVLGQKETTSAAIKNLNQIYINGTATTSWISYLVT